MKVLLAKSDSDDTLISKLKSQMAAVIKENDDLRGGDAKKLGKYINILKSPFLLSHSPSVL